MYLYNCLYIPFFTKSKPCSTLSHALRTTSLVRSLQPLPVFII